MEKVKLPSLSQMEAMTTHDLSDWLANFVLLLRRMPNVPISDFALYVPEQVIEQKNIAEKVRREKKKSSEISKDLPEWVDGEDQDRQTE